MDDSHDEVVARIENALGGVNPVLALGGLAIALRDEGMGQEEMYQRFDAVLQRHRDDADETIWDAIADTMDSIVGLSWPQSPSVRCAPPYMRCMRLAKRARGPKAGPRNWSRSESKRAL